MATLIYGLFKNHQPYPRYAGFEGAWHYHRSGPVLELIGLSAVTWLLNYVINAGGRFLVILFQPELRRGLEKIGRGKIFDIAQLGGSENGDEVKLIEEIERAVLNMSIRKIGALMVFERKTGLQDVIERNHAGRENFQRTD